MRPKSGGSIDTVTCALEMKKFNEKAAAVPGVVSSGSLVMAKPSA